MVGEKTREVVSPDNVFKKNEWGSDFAQVVEYGTLVVDFPGEYIDVGFGKVVLEIRSKGMLSVNAAAHLLTNILCALYLPRF